MASTALKVLLIIFKTVGLCNSSPTDQYPINWPLLLWQFGHLMVSIASGVLIYIYQDAIFSPEFLLTKLTDASQLVLAQLTYIVTFAMMIRYYKSQRKFWLLVNELRSNFFTIRNDVLELLNAKMRQCLAEFVIVQFFCNFIEIVILYQIYCDYLIEPEKGKPSIIAWLISRMIQLVPYNFGRLVFLFHIFLVHFIELFIDMLTDEMNYLGTISKRKPSIRPSPAQLEKRILSLKVIYARIAKLNRYLNKMFGLSHAMNMLNWFIIMTACWYFICSNLKYWEQSTHFFITFSAALAPMGIVIFVSLRFNAVEQRVMQLKTELHRIDTKGSLALVKTRLLLAHQLEHQPIRISASGFFNINNDFLKDITAVTVSYMVVLVQFMPDALHSWIIEDENVLMNRNGSAQDSALLPSYWGFFRF